MRTTRLGARSLPVLPTGVVGVRKLLSMLLLVVLVTTGFCRGHPPPRPPTRATPLHRPARSSVTSRARTTPNILDGTPYSIAKVGNTDHRRWPVQPGAELQHLHDADPPQPARLRRHHGQALRSFAPNPLGTVYKVLPAADGQSVYVAGSFTIGGRPVDAGSPVQDQRHHRRGRPDLHARQTISGDIRDLELVGNHLFLAGKFTHINGIAQKALGTVYADTGKRDPYFNAVLAGLHNPGRPARSPTSCRSRSTSRTPS